MPSSQDAQAALVLIPHGTPQNFGPIHAFATNTKKEPTKMSFDSRRKAVRDK
jgi:hypothetical protein